MARCQIGNKGQCEQEKWRLLWCRQQILLCPNDKHPLPWVGLCQETLLDLTVTLESLAWWTLGEEKGRSRQKAETGLRNREWRQRTQEQQLASCGGRVVAQWGLTLALPST